MKSKRKFLYLGILLMGVMGTGYGLALAAQPVENTPTTTTRYQLDELELIYQFTGAADDGGQGLAGRKEATAVLCSNYGSEFTYVEVRIYQSNGIDVYTSTVDLSPNQSGTLSTQDTSLYLEEGYIGGGAGTDQISQGYGEILSPDKEIICAVQVLDALSNPPEFVVSLPLYDKNGSPVGDTSSVYLPAVKKNLPTH